MAIIPWLANAGQEWWILDKSLAFCFVEIAIVVPADQPL
jgi:hypothetical protein